MLRFLIVFLHVVFMICLSGVTNYAMATLIQIDENILHDQRTDGSGLYWYADITRFFNMSNDDVLVELDVLHKEYNKQYSFGLATSSDIFELYDSANEHTIVFGLFQGTVIGRYNVYNGRIDEWEPDIYGPIQYSLSIWESSSGNKTVDPGESFPGEKFPNLGAWVKVTEIHTPVPEPSSMLLLGFGLVGLAGICRKKLKK